MYYLLNSYLFGVCFTTFINRELENLVLTIIRFSNSQSYGDTCHRHIKGAQIKRATKAEGVRCVILVHSFNVASSYTFCYASSLVTTELPKHTTNFPYSYLLNVNSLQKK